MSISVPLWMQNGAYPAQLDRILFAQLWDEGVMDLTGFKVTQRGAGANISVDVSAGEAIVTGDDQAEQGNYIVSSDAVENVALEAVPGSNSRYDIIVLKVRDEQAGGDAGDDAIVTYVKGTAASSPSVPATPDSCLLLAVIGPISSATSAITNAIITDARPLAGRRCTPGEIVFQANASAAIPNGWLLCAGQALLRSTYARLFAHIGTTFGAGDGSTTFNLPDLRGRVPVGLDNMGGSDAGRLDVSNTLGGSGGEQKHTMTATELAAHKHTPDLGSGASDNKFYTVRQGANGVNQSPVTFASLGAFAAYAEPETGSTGDGTPFNVMQPYLLLNAVIRT